MFKLIGFEPLNSGVQIIRFTNHATTSGLTFRIILRPGQVNIKYTTRLIVSFVNL